MQQEILRPANIIDLDEKLSQNVIVGKFPQAKKVRKVKDTIERDSATFQQIENEKQDFITRVEMGLRARPENTPEKISKIMASFQNW